MVHRMAGRSGVMPVETVSDVARDTYGVPPGIYVASEDIDESLSDTPHGNERSIQRAIAKFE